MLNRKCLFGGGGLCLGSSIAIFASISGDVIAQGFTEEARNTLMQIYWRIHAHNIIEETKCKLFKKEIKDKPWFIAKDYDESIKKVIGKAIADCLTNMNEFQGKKAGEIITFKNTRPEDYDQANWNAVMLYNYIACKKNKQDYRKTIEKINDYYTKFFQENNLSDKINQLNTFIINAVSDIEKYKEALNLYKHMESSISVQSCDLFLFPGKINGQYIKGIKLCTIQNKPVLQSTKLRHPPYSIVNKKIYPEFYFYKETCYIAGYKQIFHYELEKNSNRNERAEKEHTNHACLLPIKKKEEDLFIAREATYDDDWYEEQERYQNAHRIRDILEKYRSEIFDGLVEVSPLYYDE